MTPFWCIHAGRWRQRPGDRASLDRELAQAVPKRAHGREYGCLQVVCERT